MGRRDTLHVARKSVVYVAGEWLSREGREAKASKMCLLNRTPKIKADEVGM